MDVIQDFEVVGGTRLSRIGAFRLISRIKRPSDRGETIIADIYASRKRKKRGRGGWEEGGSVLVAFPIISFRSRGGGLSLLPSFLPFLFLFIYLFMPSFLRFSPGTTSPPSATKTNSISTPFPLRLGTKNRSLKSESADSRS